MSFISKLSGDLDQLSTSSYPSEYAKWKRVLELLHHLNASAGEGINGAGKHDLRAKALACLQRDVTCEAMTSIWKSLLLGSTTDLSGCFEFVNAHRFYANVFRHELPAWGQQENYCSTVMQTLVNCVIEVGSLMNADALNSVVLGLSENQLSHFTSAVLSHRVQSADVSTTLARGLDPVLSVQVAKMMFRLAVKTAQGGTAEAQSNAAANSAAIFIRSAHSKGVTTSEIMRSLVLKLNFKHLHEAEIPRLARHLAQVVVSAVPPSAVTEIFATVGGVWGDKAFVSKVDTWRQAYLTQVLLAALSCCERDCLYRTLQGGVNTDLLLSVGISHYLEVSSISIRKHGMRVAQAYATLIGETLHFAELDAVAAEEEAAEQRNSRSNASNKGARPARQTTTQAAAQPGKETPAPPSNTSPRHAASTTGVGYDSGSDDSDSSAELEGYNVDEAGAAGSVYDYKDKMLRTNYLRDCLQSK
jgi:hypothetical protein